MPERTTRDYEERDSLEVISVDVPYLCEGTLQREKRQGRAVGGEGLNGLLATTWDADRESLELCTYVYGGAILGDLMYVAIPDMRSGAPYHMSIGPPLLAL